MGNTHFIYILELLPEYQTEENWSDHTNDIISMHFNYLKKLRDEKIVVLAGKTDYYIDHRENRGIVILAVENEESAKEIMKNDPAITNNIMKAVLHPFSLALYI